MEGYAIDTDLAGWTLSGALFGGGLELFARTAAAEVVLRLDGPLRLTGRDGVERLVDAADPGEGLMAVLALGEHRIDHASRVGAGDVEVVFEDCERLRGHAAGSAGRPAESARS